VDSDQHQSLSARFEIKSLPTFKFFRDGVLTRTEMGANQQMLESWIRLELAAYNDTTRYTSGTKVILHSLDVDKYNGKVAEIKR